MMLRICGAAAALALSACGERGVMAEIERAEKNAGAQADDAGAGAQAFLDAQRGRAGVEAQPSGLLLEFKARGPNQGLPRPPAEATVLVHYEGKLADGSVFDSSFARGEPAEFPLQGVVPGFAEAIQLMRPGDEIVAYLPAELGYGAAGSPPAIPPNAVLQFRIVLLAYQGADGRVVQAPR